MYILVLEYKQLYLGSNHWCISYFMCFLSPRQRVLDGHVGCVDSCKFFPSGVVVLSGGEDMRVKIWSAEDGSCPRTFTGHTRGVCVCVCVCVCVNMAMSSRWSNHLLCSLLGITDTAIVDRGRNFICT